jgi:hypothetical protein
VNQNLSVTDQDSFNFILNSQVLTINNWDRTIYDIIFIQTINGFIQVYDFSFINNSLVIKLPSNINLGENNIITLRLTKNILIPILDFEPIIDVDGNINYPNISFNQSAYTDISYSLVPNKNLPYNKYNLYSIDSITGIVNKNNIVQEDNKIKLFTLGSLNDNKFYELKVTDYHNNISRYQIRLDSDKSIVPNIDLNFTNITNIDLIEMDFNLELVLQDVLINNNIIDNFISGGQTYYYYWLIASSDINNNLLPKTNFIPVKYDGTRFNVYGDTLNYHWDLYRITDSLVLNLYPILSHYLNTDIKNS